MVWAFNNVCGVFFALPLVLTWQWQAPTTNVDGTRLTDLAGYRLYQGVQSGTHGQIADVPKDAMTYQQEVGQREHGQTLYNVVTAVDTRGNESAPSNEVVARVPPVPPAQWDTVDVRDYGAIPNDGQSDTRAIRDAAEALNNAGGGIVYLPEGTWDIFDLPLTTETAADREAPVLSKPLTNVAIIGAGRDTTILKRIAYRTPSIDQRRVMTIGGAENLTVSDVSIDVNGINRYGGVAFYSTTNVTILRTRVYDSHPQPYNGVYDLYAYVFGFGGERHRNLVFMDNSIETLGVEIDHIDGAWVSGNAFSGCRSTACVGTFALYSDHMARDIHYMDNTITDPVKAGMMVAWDFPPGRPITGAIFEDISLIGNKVAYTKAPPTIAIRVGVGSNNIPTSGNMLRGGRIEGNRITVSPSLPVSSSPLIFANNSATANVLFEDMWVRSNQLYSTVERPFIDVRRSPASTVTVYGNEKLPSPGDQPTMRLPVAAVIASEDDGNVPANTLDGNLSTRWSALGKGQWIRYDLGIAKAVSTVRIAWYVGRSRQASFAIEVSADGTTWKEMHNGQSSGTTDGLESYSFPAEPGRYVRIKGFGNTQSQWNSVTEVEVYGKNS